MSNTHRLFFALWPTTELRNQLGAYTAASAQIAGRPMAPDNLHVTLAFVGSVPAIRMPDLIELGGHNHFTGCAITFDRLVVWKQARVLVLTASQVPEPLQQLARALQTQLSETGFQVDDRPFRPHITLAREVRAPASDDPIAPLTWSARDFVLVESVSTANGVRYKVVATFGR